MSPTDFLAIYGALLATGLAAWDITKYALEARCLRVSCYIAKMFTPGDGIKESDRARLLAYSIANTGGKPIVVVSVGGLYSDGTGFVLIQETPQLPRTLEPGESVTVTGPFPTEIDRIKHFNAWDALGKQWTASPKAVRAQLAAKPLAAEPGA